MILSFMTFMLQVAMLVRTDDVITFTFLNGYGLLLELTIELMWIEVKY